MKTKWLSTLRNNKFFTYFFRSVFFVFCFGCLATSCNNNSIPLGIVRNIPVYFKNNMLFGENIKTMEEKNAFIVATGLIDTTDEHPPIRVAFVSIDNRLLELTFIEGTRNGDKITDAYYSNGFTLLVSTVAGKADDPKSRYEKAHIRIGNKNGHSEYDVFGRPGYDRPGLYGALRLSTSLLNTFY